MAIRAFLSAFLSTSLPEYSLVIVRSIVETQEKPRIGSVAGAGFFDDLPSLVNASDRHPAPATPDEEQRKGKGYEYDDVRREVRAAEINVVLQSPGLHTMRAIATQVFAHCQRRHL